MTATSSAQGNIISNLTNKQAIGIIKNNNIVPDVILNEIVDVNLSTSELIYKILSENRDAFFDDIRVSGKLTTNELNINNNLSIGDTSGDTFKVIQLIDKDIYKQDISDQIINDTTYEIINDISLSLTTKNSNGYFQFSVTFNYLTSTYYNTFLKIGLFYYTTINDLGINSNEKLIGEYILGNENTNFIYGVFSKTMVIDISHSANDTINFYLKAKIQTDDIGNDFNYSDLDNTLKPKIIQTLSGNLISAAEFSTYI